MIEIHVRPATRIVAVSTGWAKLTLMLIILLMTGNTVHRRTAIAARMAAFARNTDMFPSQLESG